MMRRLVGRCCATTARNSEEKRLAVQIKLNHKFNFIILLQKLCQTKLKFSNNNNPNIFKCKRNHTECDKIRSMTIWEVSEEV